MDLQSACAYVRENHETHEFSDDCVLGFIYQPNHPDCEICIMEILYESVEDRADIPENHDEHGNVTEYYYAYMQAVGAGANESLTIGRFNGMTYESFLSNLPDFVSSIDFEVYTVTTPILNHAVTDALKEIFPVLPAPTDDHFKESAVGLINRINSHQTKPTSKLNH